MEPGVVSHGCPPVPHDDIGGFWTWLPSDQAIIDATAKTFMTLKESVFLRSSDCMHLVTALHHNFAEIYTFDVHRSRAAAKLGLKTTAV
jgi:predicted nucleic acid-binding protein